MASQPVHYISPEEYLKAERQAEFKSEYYQGQVFAMSGASPRHNRIATNLVVELSLATRGTGCQVFGSDLRIHIPKTGLYTYPDVSVVCGEPVVFATDNLENPVLIVEVLSKSTEHHDRTTKFLDYQSIPSLREYLLVSQHSRSITRCVRTQDGKWQIDTLSDSTEPIHLSSIGADLTFDQVYAGAEALPGSR